MFFKYVGLNPCDDHSAAGVSHLVDFLNYLRILVQVMVSPFCEGLQPAWGSVYQIQDSSYNLRKNCVYQKGCNAENNCEAAY